MQSLTSLDMTEMKEAGAESIEHLGWHGLDSTAKCKISNTTTKRKLIVLINCITKKIMRLRKDYERHVQRVTRNH